MPIDDNIIGKKLARSIYRADGNLLLAAGVTIRKEIADRLRELGISFAYVTTPPARSTEVVETIAENTRLEVTRQVAQAMRQIDVGEQPDLDRLKKIVESILEEVIATQPMLLLLVDVRAAPDYTFAHSTGVLVFALASGLGLGLASEDLRKLGFGALFHDVGKIRIPESILQKEAALNAEEWELMKAHTTIGLDLLRQVVGFNLAAAQVALQHHEKVDGSGYPQGLKGQAIHEYARIAAVADVYDALVTDRPYRRGRLPHEASAIIRAGAGTYFDPNVVNSFLSCVVPYPVGIEVYLSTGELARVIGVNRAMPERPIVKLLRDRNGRALRSKPEIDLGQWPSIAILARRQQADDNLEH